MKQKLVEALTPFVDFLDKIDLSEKESKSKIQAAFPLESKAMQSLALLLQEGISRGDICTHDGGPGVTYSRIAKEQGQRKFSIDAVQMNGPGPGHCHPKGEVDLCFSAEGEPTFDGNEPGWTIYGENSWHVPTVKGGTMNILYFLPEGEIVFGPKDKN